MNEEKYYQIEIINPDTACEKKIALLIASSEVKLLFEELTDFREVIEFSARMRFNPSVLEENFDGYGSNLHDHNIIELVSARKVKV